METKSVRVAVIGAGMAGLVAARELQRENHDVVIFEKSRQIGGLWIFDNCSEADTLGLDPTRQIVHSSMYDSLRTNLPRHLMGFLDYPFTTKEGGDSRTFPGQEEVLRFLNDFATDFDLVKLIRFDSTVVRIEHEIDGENISWTVESRTWGVAASTVEVFEAVVVCNGHNTQPRIADFPGRSTWPGIQVHSHNHRYAQSFTDQIVVIIGNGASALEISNDILPYAKEVHQATRTRITADQDPEKLRFNNNNAAIMQHPMIKCAEEDGKIVFEDGSSLYADAILHCTGYSYDFPFLKTNDIVTVDDNRVGPLYKHVFAARAADTLSFIGLTYLDTPPLVMELQSKWVARVLARKMFTSSEEYMLLLLEQEYAEIEELGWPKHHTHRLQKDLFGYETQFGYEKWLNDLLFLDPLEKWRVEMFFTLFTLPAKYGLNYRDEWDADKWLQEFEQQELSNNNNN